IPAADRVSRIADDWWWRLRAEGRAPRTAIVRVAWSPRSKQPVDESASPCESCHGASENGEGWEDQLALIVESHRVLLKRPGRSASFRKTTSDAFESATVASKRCARVARGKQSHLRSARCQCMGRFTHLRLMIAGSHCARPK